MDDETEACGAGKKCESGNCVNLVGELSASYSNLQKNSGSKPPGVPDGDNWWYFDDTLRETSGNVGITVQRRQKCYNRPSNCGSFCDSVKTDIASKFGTDYIPPGGQIIRNNDWTYHASFCTTITVTDTYWGIDDNGNNVQDSNVFTVS